MSLAPILPAKTVTASPNNGSANVQLPGWENGAQIVLLNTGSELAFYNLGADNTVTADATAHPLPANVPLHITRRPGQKWIAFFSTGNPACYATCGEGH